VLALLLGTAPAALAGSASAEEGSAAGEKTFLGAPPFPDLPISEAVRLRLTTFIAPNAGVGSGEITLVRPELAARVTWPASDDLVLRLAMRFSESHYDFRGDVWGTRFDALPTLNFDPDRLIGDLDLYALRLALEGAYRLSGSTRWFADDEQWAVVASAYGGSRWEDGDFHSGLDAGAALGIGYEIPKRLRLALGVTLRTPLDKADLAFGPLFSVRWRPTDRITVRTRELGLQAEYKLRPAFEVFLAGFRTSDAFVLNDRNPLHDLVFRDRQLRFGAGFNWTLANWLQIALEGGAIADRRLRVKEENFGTLMSRSGDAAGYGEIRVELRL